MYINIQPKTAVCRILSPLQPIFKEKSNYPDFLHNRMARRQNYSG